MAIYDLADGNVALPPGRGSTSPLVVLTSPVIDLTGKEQGDEFHLWNLPEGTFIIESIMRVEATDVVGAAIDFECGGSGGMTGIAGDASAFTNGIAGDNGWKHISAGTVKVVLDTLGSSPTQGSVQVTMIVCTTGMQDLPS